MKTVIIFSALSFLIQPLQCLYYQETSQEIPCGIPRKTIVGLILRGNSADAQEHPWHASVFHLIESIWWYQCGGTLITDRLVVTARHCTLLDGIGSQLPTDEVLVKLGLSELDSDNFYTENYSVSAIHTVNQEKTRNFRNDIALLQLNEAVEYSDYILPACLINQDVVVGEIGTVVGFGRTETQNVSNTLRKLSAPVVHPFTCLRRHNDFAKEIDKNHFCAGHTDGRAVCNGDSGGGFMLLRNGTMQLGGLISFTASRSNFDYRCREDGYAAYTSIYNYLPWIYRNIRDSQPNKHYKEIAFGIPRKANVRWTYGGKTVDAQEHPWHATLFYRNEYEWERQTEWQYRCGGTLISNRIVVTLVGCTNIHIDVILVKLGMQEIDYDSAHTQNCTITAIYRPANALPKDIALLELSSTIMFSDYIIPARLVNLDVNVDETGTVVSFSSIQTDSKMLQMFKVPVVNTSTCTHNAYIMDERNFCAGHMDRRTVCIGDSGGGLLFSRNGTMQLGGVFTFIPDTDYEGNYLCQEDAYGVYTNIYSYLPWITNFITDIKTYPRQRYETPQTDTVLIVTIHKHVKYGPKSEGWHLFCEGVVVSDRLVLTIGCFFKEYYKVRVSITDEPWISKHDIFNYFYRDVDSIYIYKYTENRLTLLETTYRFSNDVLETISLPTSDELGLYDHLISYSFNISPSLENITYFEDNKRQCLTKCSHYKNIKDLNTNKTNLLCLRTVTHKQLGSLIGIYSYRNGIKTFVILGGRRFNCDDNYALFILLDYNDTVRINRSIPPKKYTQT